jgi:cytochrome c-type biogenesis protein CcmH/NrfF
MSRALHRALAAGIACAALVCALPGVARARGPQGVPERATQVAAGAADSVLEARTTAVASQLRCPVCQGLSIQESPSELAQQMRRVVRDQLAAGRSPADVQAYFVSKYGEWILLSPAPHGMNLLVYGLPVALVLVGLAGIAFAVRRWTSAPLEQPPA